VAEPQTCIPAVFMRGGTSNALVFHRRDLPPERTDWDALFLAALGSPDPHGRQLDGMGGGISSLSKVVVVSPSAQPGVAIDYLFAQVSVEHALVDYRSNCGNLTAAVGPFVEEEGLNRRPESSKRASLVRPSVHEWRLSVAPQDSGATRPPRARKHHLAAGREAQVLR